MIFNVKQGVKLDQTLFKINTQRLQEFNKGGESLTSLPRAGLESAAP